MRRYAIGVGIGIVAIVVSCSSFGESGDPSTMGPDASTPNPPVDGGGTSDVIKSNDASSAFRCPEPLPPDVVYCQDFEGAVALDPVSGGEALEVVPGFEDSGRSLRAFFPATQSQEALDVGFTQVLGDEPQVVLEADVYIKSSPNPKSEDLGELGFLNIGRGYESGGGVGWIVNAFVDEGQVFLTAATPEFQAGPKAKKPFPHRQWMHVRLTANHVGAYYHLEFAERGADLESIVQYSPPSGPTASPAETRTFVGIQRYNNPTPDLEVFYDYVVVRRP